MIFYSLYLFDSTSLSLSHAHTHTYIHTRTHSLFLPQSFRYKMSECIYDMTALSHLKDSIVDIIKHDRNPKLQPAKDLLKRVDERKLVRSIYYIYLSF